MKRFRQAASLLFFLSYCISAADTTPIVELRLDTTLTSYTSKPGTRFRAVVIAPVEWAGEVLMPAGTIVSGVVKRSRRVGMGLVRERSSIDLEFREYQLPTGEYFPFEAYLSDIDNGREAVGRKGRIEGILAASNPQSFVSGVWYRPNAGMFPRSVAGLTGAGGHIWTRFSMGPIGAVCLFALRFAAFKLPEPEIRLPKGTEMKAHLAGLSPDAPRFEKPPGLAIPDDFAVWVGSMRAAVTKPGGNRADDIINIVMTGSREDVIRAFAAAGWWQPEAINTRSFRRAYQAYATQTGYPQAPVSKLFYEGEEPGLVFQKSLNTIAKRHHIRLWPKDWNGVTVWLGAATQDTGIVFRSGAFSHKIDPRIDTERDKVVSDLEFSQCSSRAGFVERNWAVSAGPIHTDGKAAILDVAARCENGRSEPEELLEPPLPGTKVTRALRRTVLETRHYFTRGNAYYWAIRAVRLRKKKPNVEPVFAWSVPPVAPPTGDAIRVGNQD